MIQPGAAPQSIHFAFHKLATATFLVAKSYDDRAAAEQVPDPSTVPGLRTTLAAGYIPCLEAVLRRRLMPYTLDHERKRYTCNFSGGPQVLTGA